MSENRMKPKHLVVSCVLVMLMSVLIIVSVQPTTAQFVIASWDYPDEYGQGIEMFAFYENSTGSWLPYGDAYEYDQSYTVEWNASIGIKLRCYTFFNSTLTGAGSTDEGKLYQRHNVTVVELGTTIFSQQNFTYYSVSTVLAPMWYYGYEVVLNFLPGAGLFYTVTVTYDIWW